MSASSSLAQTCIDYPDQTALLEMHLRSGYPLYCAEALQRIYYYPSPYVTPMLKYDGLNGGSSYSAWRNLIINRFGVNAPVTITMWGEYTDGTGTINVQFRNDSTVTLTGRAHIVVTEDSIYYPSPNGDQWHNHVVRDYVPSYTGTYTSIPAGDSVTVTQSFSVQANWVEDNCEIVSWLQQDGTRTVYQGGKVKVTILGQEEHKEEVTPAQRICPTPNPCVNGTEFAFELPTGTAYNLDIYDVTGRRIQAINGVASGTNESVRWNCDRENGEKVSSGVYFYRFESDLTTTTGKIIVK